MRAHQITLLVTGLIGETLPDGLVKTILKNPDSGAFSDVVVVAV